MGDLQYPVGKFEWPRLVRDEDRARWAAELGDTPEWLAAAVEGLDVRQLDTPYREGGWTVRQVVHHLADSHLNAYARVRLALTEETPSIKPYDQDAWANLPDARHGVVAPSLAILVALHERWVALLSSLTPEQFEREFHHPELDRCVSLNVMLAMYAWHGRHHVAHITNLRERMGW
jgi:hypothetical protein